jgi:hypothetical protein
MAPKLQSIQSVDKRAAYYADSFLYKTNMEKLSFTTVIHTLKNTRIDAANGHDLAGVLKYLV